MSSYKFSQSILTKISIVRTFEDGYLYTVLSPLTNSIILLLIIS
nr:MAG TPA_asm: hypothetical protein [Caudoviricetes sp.]